MKVYVVMLEIQGEKPAAVAAFPSMELAKRNVFEQEHLYDDENVLLADQRDVTWLEDGDSEVADGLGGDCTYTVTPLDLDVSVDDVVRARLATYRQS